MKNTIKKKSKSRMNTYAVGLAAAVENKVVPETCEKTQTELF